MEESRRKEAANAGKLVILTGPTAVGKTALSVALAKKIGGEIISADSMQVYRGMDIGTAKIRPEEMKAKNGSVMAQPAEPCLPDSASALLQTGRQRRMSSAPCAARC